jgi:hypothetical protein
MNSEEKDGIREDDRKVENLNENLNKYIAWMKKMKKDGWIWDGVQNGWYKQDKNGKKVFYEGPAYELKVGN